MTRDQMIKRIQDIPALVRQLEAIAEDNEIDWQDMPESQIKRWAESRLDNFYEAGHTLNDMLTGQLSKQEQASANNQVRLLRKLIKELK